MAAFFYGEKGGVTVSRLACFLSAILVFTLAPLVVSADDACGGDLGCVPCCPTWTVAADAIFLNRTQADFSDPLLFPAGPRQQFSFSPGWQVDLRRESPSGRTLQVRHFGLDNWTAAMSYSTGPPFPGSGFVHYSSELYSTEANIRCSTGSCVTWLIGFRSVELYENWNQGADIFFFNIDFAGRTRNHMYGCQVGADLDLYDRGGPFRLDAEFKLGILGNHIKRTEQLFAGAIPIGPAVENRLNHTSLLGEINILARYQLCDHVALRGGYQMLWVDGVAMAPANFGGLLMQTTAASTLFAHGVSGGLEVTW